METHQQTRKLSTRSSFTVADENAGDDDSREDHDTARDWSDVVGGDEIDCLYTTMLLFIDYTGCLIMKEVKYDHCA